MLLPATVPLTRAYCLSAFGPAVPVRSAPFCVRSIRIVSSCAAPLFGSTALNVPDHLPVKFSAARSETPASTRANISAIATRFIDVSSGRPALSRGAYHRHKITSPNHGGFRQQCRDDAPALRRARERPGTAVAVRRRLHARQGPRGLRARQAE